MPEDPTPIELDPAALLIVLRTLPRRLLLTALDLHAHCWECGVCQVCTTCACLREG